MVAFDGSSTTDEDSMAKAMKRKAELNMDMAGMFASQKLFLHSQIQALLLN